MSKNKKRRRVWILSILGVLLVGAFFVYKSLFPGRILDDVPNPVSDKATVSKTLNETDVTVYPLNEAFFGDLHVHTRFSFDAYIGNCVASPTDAYIFAKGNTIEILGRQVKLRRPLDFAAVTDHSEFLGELYTIQNSDERGHNALLARVFRSVRTDTVRMRQLFDQIRTRPHNRERQHFNFFQGYETTKKAWMETLLAAEEHYQPGTFTTLAGYEWTNTHGHGHLHRNVIFRDMVVPDYPVSALEARTPEDFWKSLEVYTQEGSKVLAIPHNSNLSKGFMFPQTKLDGSPIDVDYVTMSNRYEPLVEIHQAKGNSEVHAEFWENDEFADFENSSFLPAQKNNYVRDALKRGLKYEAELGVNPYKYGLIGSTDTHNATSGNTEENDDFIGNHSRIDENAESRRNSEWVLTASEADYGRKTYQALNPGGLVAVWAQSNTRGDIWDALERKEAFATSGGRIKVRFFGGYDFKSQYTLYEELVQAGYNKGIPMGGDLSENKTPSFIIWAQKDAESANLDRIQVIKGWYKDGELHEKIYNVALSDNRKLNSDGTVPDNGATVNMETGEWDKSKGAIELQTVWTDPDFDASARCFYYLRVLELPTARYTLIDEIRDGVKYPESTKRTIRERAWSSPIWYSPK